MANDFSGDANCVALYTMENDWPTSQTLDDEGPVGTNDMTTEGSGSPAEPDRVAHGEGAPPFEGTYAADFEGSVQEFFEIVDGSLSAGFPGKSAGGGVDWSVCFWMKPESSTADGSPVAKYDTASKRSFWIKTESSDDAVAVVIGYNNGESFTSDADHLGTIVDGQRYHVGVTWDQSEQTIKIRIWDDNGSAILQSGGNDTFSENVGQSMSLDSGSFAIGARYVSGSRSDTFDGLLDEVVVFKDILSDAEIDQIRAGTYGPAPPAGIEIFRRRIEGY